MADTRYYFGKKNGLYSVMVQHTHINFATQINNYIFSQSYSQVTLAFPGMETRLYFGCRVQLCIWVRKGPVNISSIINQAS